MHTKDSLIKDIEAAGINKNGTLLIHSSMKAIGPVGGGADTVLEAFIEYMKDGLLLFPTHSWSDKNLPDGIYNPKTESSCVGLLTNLFMQKKGAARSMHPTHSVTATGKRAQEYVLRDNEVYTPCPRNGCFGGLYDEDAQILFLGATLKTNTFIHSVEEWMNIPNRINPQSRKIKIQHDSGDVHEIDFHGHFSTCGDVSKNYDKLLAPMLGMGIAQETKIGDALSYVVKVKPMADWVVKLLEGNPLLFDDDQPIRCFGDTPLYIDYHDNEWGRPVHDDRKLFEMLILEGAQAGLSWITVLNKREAYRQAFDGFDPKKVALYDDAKIEELMANAGIIRNRLKIRAAITNAKLFLEIVDREGSFDKFIWSYVDYSPIIGDWESIESVPVNTPISDKISKDLKKMGFKFVGSTIIYSFMQAVGMVNDHLRSCCCKTLLNFVGVV